MPKEGSVARSLRRIARVSRLRSSSGSSSGLSSSAVPASSSSAKRATNSSALERRSATTSTRLPAAARTAAAFSAVWVCPLPAGALMATDSPASMRSRAACWDSSASSSKSSSAGSRWSLVRRAPVAFLPALVPGAAAPEPSAGPLVRLISASKSLASTGCATSMVPGSAGSARSAKVEISRRWAMTMPETSATWVRSASMARVGSKRAME